MPPSDILLGLSGFAIKGFRGKNPVEIETSSEGTVKCPHCSSQELRKKDRFIRRVRHSNIGYRACYLLIEAFKFHCLSCNRYFNQRLQGIGKWRKHSEAYRKQIVYQHRDGISQQDISKRERIGSATVERWMHEILEIKSHEYSSAYCPKILGIDEHFFSKKNGYATTWCDLEKHRVFDVVLGRSEKALSPYIDDLRGKSQVQMICMDLSSTYRAIAKKHFPRAKIVADRFHVIRLVNQQFLQTWKLIDPKGRANRGLLSLMRRHEENLKDDQKIKLKDYLKQYPALKVIYEFKQKLNRLLLIKHRTVKQCKKLIPKLIHFVDQLIQSKLEPLIQLGKTINSWKHEIARMWRFTKNNAITEGFHNKMELISRRAYGFKNFKNYRLRVRMLCS